MIVFGKTAFAAPALYKTAAVFIFLLDHMRLMK